MAGGLAALLDDVAAIAKLAASSLDDVGAAATKASVKATGVVVDDTAVTPQYVSGVSPERELPIIKKIAVGSLRNKLLIILPLALLLSAFAPWLLTPILMCGGAFLSYEGAHKVWGMLTGHGAHGGDGGVDEPVAAEGAEQEDELVKGAIRTDLILSAEIMVISLNSVAHQAFLTRALSLVVVAFLITALVYGVVALIVKLDDIGLGMTRRGHQSGRLVVKSMPVILSVLSTVGLAAMLWVGGHILMVGMDELGLSWPYHVVHGAEHHVHEAVPHALAGTLGWLTNTLGSAVIGLVVGSVIVAVMALVHRVRGGAHGSEDVPARPRDAADGIATGAHQATATATGAARHGDPQHTQAAGEWPGEGTIDVGPGDREG